MATTTLSWLHISDLHIMDSSLLKVIIGEQESFAKQREFSFIVVTGDLRDKDCTCKEDKYTKAKEYLEKLNELFKIGEENIFIVPGNHDAEHFKYRKEIINTIVKEFPTNYDVVSCYLKDSPNLLDAFDSYSKFAYEFYNDSKDKESENEKKESTSPTKSEKDNEEIPKDKIEKYASTRVVQVPRDKPLVNLILLNTALISDGDRSHAEIVDIGSLYDIQVDENLPSIVIAHHNFDSIHEIHQNMLLRRFSSLKVRAYLCGDLHKTKLSNITNCNTAFERQNIPCIACGVSVANPKDFFSETSMMTYDLKDDGYVYVTPYVWEKEKMHFIKANSFLYDVDKEYRFPMTKPYDFSYSKYYAHITDIHNDIAEEIKKTDFFYFYGLRGATFVGNEETNKIVKALRERRLSNKDSLDLRFLISDPTKDNIELINRLESVFKKNFEFKLSETKEKANELISEYGDRVKFHSNPLIFRFIITESSLYFGYYEPNEQAIKSSMFKFLSDTPTYKTYLSFFNKQWESFIPSLVINTDGECNMKCVYCPPGGENLGKINEKLKIEKKLSVIKQFAEILDKKKKILRITGGEPLIKPDEVSCLFEAAKDYNKIILCTNGTNLKEAFEKNTEKWNAVKDKLLLKISLDTLDPDVFDDITKTHGLFDTVKNNILFMNKNGFKIELNLVATSKNIKGNDDFLKVFDFAYTNNLVGLKVLTVNDFGGSVNFEQKPEEIIAIEEKIRKVMLELKERGYEEKNVYLNETSGIKMKRFYAKNSMGEYTTFTIVDHSNSTNSITPRRTFSKFCKDCNFYIKNKCNTGMMSLNLRADGKLSACRLRYDCGSDISKLKDEKEIKKAIKQELEKFQGYVHEGGTHKYKKGYICGFFDLIHDGHIEILKYAKSMCNYLIVAVGTDEFMEQRKSRSSVLSYDQRVKIVSSLKYVDEVVPQTGLDKVGDYHKYNFDVMFAGDDHIDEEVYINATKELKELGVDVIYFKRVEDVSSTKIREKIKGK